MATRLRPTPAFEFSGGVPCLDFVNTLGDRPRAQHDRLAGYADVLRWSAEAGLLARPERQRLARRASRQPPLAAAAFRKAVELRECLYRIFSALAARRRPATADLESLNRTLQELLNCTRLTPTKSGFAWSWAGPAARLDGPLWPVVRSAGELLTSSEIGTIRECASDNCSWLFLDCSRTRRRRWCDMKTCGNRAKARRYYERHKHRS